jgi:hypothetical protein
MTRHPTTLPMIKNTVSVVRSDVAAESGGTGKSWLNSRSGVA